MKLIENIVKNLNISMPNIIVRNDLSFLYLPKIDTIFIKDNVKREVLYFGLIHELRHKYQYMNLDKNKLWRYEFENYNKLPYIYLDIELDAYSYSYIELKKLNMELYLKNDIYINIVKEYINEKFIKEESNEIHI